MWLHELKKENESPAREQELKVPEPVDEPAENDAFTITTEEHVRWKARVKDLCQSLAQTVRHIDPTEYTEGRIQGLLAMARQNGSKKISVRRSLRQSETRKEDRNAVPALPRAPRRRA